MSTLFIYHGGCFDGHTAAWIYSRYVDRDAEFFPAKYGDQPPDVRSRDVIIADFSYPLAILRKIAEQANSLQLYDHHTTSQEDLAPLVLELAAVRRVPLSQKRGKADAGPIKYAYVDADDYDKVSTYSWSLSKGSGVTAYAGGGRRNRKSITMHRLIFGPSNALIDHVNRNVLDNRRANLRVATRQQNAANMHRGSKWKGVTTHKLKSGNIKFRAMITVNHKPQYLGSFDTAEEAGRAYDAAAVKAFGEYARGNSMHSGPFPANARIVFDMNRSGAGIVWDELAVKRGGTCEECGSGHTDKGAVGHIAGCPFSRRPALVAFVEDRDLWRLAIPHAHEYMANVYAAPMTFEAWDVLHMRPVESMLDRGAAILEYMEEYGTKALAEARQFTWTSLLTTTHFQDSFVWCVNLPYMNCSDYLTRLLAEKGMLRRMPLRASRLRQRSLHVLRRSTQARG